MNFELSHMLILLAMVNFIRCDDLLPPPCFSDIYCHGRLLHTIQMAKIYKDSKTFVDMKMKFPVNETWDRFENFMKKYDNNPDRNEVKEFVEDTFDPAGQEFEKWEPKDWIPNPKFADRIQDPQLRKWAIDLNNIWKVLGRKMKEEVKENKESYSIIWVPNPVIVPGGRFREFYYWDSYWIIKGLLHSEMTDTVKGMLENFLSIIDNYGHIPNGGRIYYLQRSQPPLLIPMVKLYFDKTNNHTFIEKNIATMEKEFSYWITNHTTVIQMNDKNYTLAVYGDKSRGPRPESYSEDVGGAFQLNELKKEAYYSELKAAAESGWDFSSRWFITNTTNKGNLSDIKTRSIVPVDLNALIYWNAMLLAEFKTNLNMTKEAQYYTDVANKWKEAVAAVLWHEEVGIWLDYDLLNSVKRDYFYPSNIAPMWTGCYSISDKDKIVNLVMKYLHNKHIMYNPGGIPTSTEHTGEQWDYPNAWPPLQHMMVVALNNSGDSSAQRLAFEIAQKWVKSNYKAFKQTGAMFEKYDATVPGASGGGGEYIIQEGFGWSNGVIMDLLDLYHDQLLAEEPVLFVETKSVGASSINSVTTALIALLVSLTAGFIGVWLYRRRNSQQLRNKSQLPGASNVKYTELRSIQRDGKKPQL